MNACIRRAKTGDQRATRELVEALKPRISRMAVYYSRCTGEDPDDLQQEAWLALLEALPEVELHIGTPVHYLTARARWRMLDVIKRARIRRCAPLDDSGIEAMRDTKAECALSAVLASEFTEQLKDTQRNVVECLLAGLTWREAGDKLGCASANIAYHVRQIRRQYEEWDNELVCKI